MDENENSSKHDGLFKGVLYGSITGVALSLITGSPGVIPLASLREPFTTGSPAMRRSNGPTLPSYIPS